MDAIIAIIAAVVVLGLMFLGHRLGISLFHKLQKLEISSGSKIMVSFLAGFIVFIILTGRVQHPLQKIPIIAVALLLAWANLFLGRPANQ